MTTIRVTYHREQGVWWADSVDLAGWHAGGDTLSQARQQVREGLAFFVGLDVEILESDEHGRPVVVSSIRSLPNAWFGTTRTDSPPPSPLTRHGAVVISA